MTEAVTIKIKPLLKCASTLIRQQLAPPGLTMLSACIYFSLLISSPASAIDIAITHAPLDEKDRLQEYVYLVLEESLIASKPVFGEYKMAQAHKALPRDRQFAELIKGEKLTVISSAPKAAWTGKTLRVPFPIHKGLSSYRIFLVMKKNKNLLAGVSNVNQLKLLSTGTNINWSTTKILDDHGFNTVKALGYKSLFDMLAHERFQTLNRGITEIGLELETFGKIHQNLSYDEHVVLYTYLPNYFYVTPTQPELAERIEYGLKQMHLNGKLDSIFERYYSEVVDTYKLHERKKFVISNTNLAPGMYETDKPYLLSD